jgi:hypothetical protein
MAWLSALGDGGLAACGREGWLGGLSFFGVGAVVQGQDREEEGRGLCIFMKKSKEGELSRRSQNQALGFFSSMHSLTVIIFWLADR